MQTYAVVSIYNVKSPDLTNETFYKDKEKNDECKFGLIGESLE
jgi:hypothetical protein